MNEGMMKKTRIKIKKKGFTTLHIYFILINNVYVQYVAEKLNVLLPDSIFDY